MQSVLDSTSVEFLSSTKLIAATKRIPLSNVLYDIWMEYYIWKQKAEFEGGAINILGNFTEKTSAVLSSYAKVSSIDRLDDLVDIPQAYAVLLEVEDQAYTRHHFFNEFAKHYKKSRTPPPVFMLGRFRPGVDAVGHVLTVAPSEGAINLRLAAALSDQFKMTSCSISMVPANISEKAPYLMFGCRLQFTAIG